VAPRLAYVGNDRQIHVIDALGGTERAVTLPLGGILLPPGLMPLREGWAWPTWSPDGRWLACIQFPLADEVRGPFQVHLVEVDGVEQRMLCEMNGEKPIYTQWSAMGDTLAILAHGSNYVALLHGSMENLGVLNRVEFGVPLFFSWAPDDRLLLLHVGPTALRPGQIVLKDPLGRRADRRSAHGPGKFCAPVYVGDHAVYVVEGAQEGISDVVVTDEPGRPERVLFSGRGLLAIVPSADGEHLAVSSATGGEHTPYNGVSEVSVETGQTRVLTREDCLAFFYGPKAAGLLYAVVDPEENCIHWKQAPQGSTGGAQGLEATHRKLTSFWPTRETMFFLHFFDQYSLAHSVVSSDGRYLAWAGFPASRGHADLSGPARVFILDLLDPDCQPREVAEGTFATWEPALPPLGSRS
jgi:hypothetical protein